MNLTTKELEPSTWSDFASLIAKQGQCWCMYYQREESRAKESHRYAVREGQAGQHNKQRKHDLVNRGQAHGIIVYDATQPIAWCAYGPQEEYPRVDRGRLYRKLNPKAETKLWRIPCFFVASEYRRRGISQYALRAALDTIRQKGGGVVEAYPRIGKQGGPINLWFGTVAMFEREGFRRVGTLGVSVLMRKTISHRSS